MTKLVLLLVADQVGEDAQGFVSLADVAERAEIDLPGVSRAMQVLHDQGRIHWNPPADPRRAWVLMRYLSA